MPIVTLLSDFGTRDGFVAAMKGVVAAVSPEARIIDATHDIEPGDIEAAAFVLAQYWDLYPPGTVHLAVVDPGVGSERKALVLVADQRFVVAPDNGIITRVVKAAVDWRCVEVRERRYLRTEVSSTFHGRDVFAPVAAHLSSGVPADQLGPALGHPVLVEVDPPLRRAARLQGRVVHVDRFGNLITDIPAAWLDLPWRFRVAEHDVGAVRRTYSDVRAGELLAVVGSLGTVEIAVRQGSASEMTGAGRGAEVVAEV
jgi:S-adenosylmethionine hydrolase